MIRISDASSIGYIVSDDVAADSWSRWPDVDARIAVIASTTAEWLGRSVDDLDGTVIRIVWSDDQTTADCGGQAAGCVWVEERKIELAVELGRCPELSELCHELIHILIGDPDHTNRAIWSNYRSVLQMGLALEHADCWQTTP
jgi:hypothetical protein